MSSFFPLLGSSSWAKILLLLGCWEDNECEAMETTRWSGCLGGGGGGGGSGKDTTGHPWLCGWGSWIISLHPSLTGTSGCKDTCGSTGMPMMLGWGCNGDLTGGGGGLKYHWHARFIRPIWRSWLNFSESTSKWIENLSLLFMPLGQPTGWPVFQFPLFPLLSLLFPWLEKLIY